MTTPNMEELTRSPALSVSLSLPPALCLCLSLSLSLSVSLFLSLCLSLYIHTYAHHTHGNLCMHALYMYLYMHTSCMYIHLRPLCGYSGPQQSEACCELFVPPPEPRNRASSPIQSLIGPYHTVFQGTQVYGWL